MAFVMKYGDHLEVEHSLDAAEKIIAKRLPDLPDETFEEDDDGKEVAEFNAVVTDGKVKLVRLGEFDEYGVNVNGENPFEKNFDCKEGAVEAGMAYLRDNPDAGHAVIFQLTIRGNTILEDKTLETISRSEAVEIGERRKTRPGGG